MGSRKLAVKLIKSLLYIVLKYCASFKPSTCKTTLTRSVKIFLIFFRFEGLKEQSSENEEISHLYEPKHARTARAAGQFFYVITRSF
jgi:hypothetical protein